MAASCMALLRSLAVSDLRPLSNRCQCLGQSAAFKSPSFDHYLKSSSNRRVHCSHGTVLMCVKPETHRTTEEVDQDQPDYIPREKAKNPMMKIGYAWMIGLPTGIIGFILAKREVDKNRLKQLKIRQRMKRANEGVYESERYKLHQKVE